MYVAVVQKSGLDGPAPALANSASNPEVDHLSSQYTVHGVIQLHLITAHIPLLLQQFPENQVLVLDSLVEFRLHWRCGSSCLGLLVPGSSPAVDTAAVFVTLDGGLDLQGDGDVEVTPPKQLFVLIEVVDVLGMLAVRFDELAMRAVELLVGLIGLIVALAVIVNRHLVLIGAVEDPRWRWGYLLRQNLVSMRLKSVVLSLRVVLIQVSWVQILCCWGSAGGWLNLVKSMLLLLKQSRPSAIAFYLRIQAPRSKYKPLSLLSFHINNNPSLPNCREVVSSLRGVLIHLIWIEQQYDIQSRCMSKKEVTYQAVNEFIIAIKCCAMDVIHRFLRQYNPIIVNRLETQTRQPSLYFAAILIDHQQSYELMKLLIQHGANAHFKDNYQQTILFYVCREGKEKCLDLLLEQGLNLNDEDIYGQTPLFYAAKENRLNIIHKLIEKEMNANHVDKIAQQTPLFYAAREGHLEMCKILIEAGCDLSHQDTSHKMASHYAKKYTKNEVFDYLSNEYQTLKDQKKIMSDSRQESNPQEKVVAKPKKKREMNAANVSTKAFYRLYRSDAFGNSNEVSQAEYEQLLANYPELQEMLRNPDEIDMTSYEQIKAKQAWIKIAQKVLSICWKSKGGYYFHQPVDPSKYGIIDYFDIISQPMDFGTIKKKLTFNVYNNVQQFSYDMKLVFDNCVKYNGTENLIAKHAIDIKNLFEQNMKQTGYMN